MFNSQNNPFQSPPSPFGNLFGVQQPQTTPKQPMFGSTSNNEATYSPAEFSFQNSSKGSIGVSNHLPKGPIGNTWTPSVNHIGQSSSQATDNSKGVFGYPSVIRQSNHLFETSSSLFSAQPGTKQIKTSSSPHVVAGLHPAPLLTFTPAADCPCCIADKKIAQLTRASPSSPISVTDLRSNLKARVEETCTKFMQDLKDQEDPKPVIQKSDGQSTSFFTKPGTFSKSSALNLMDAFNQKKDDVIQKPEQLSGTPNTATVRDDIDPTDPELTESQWEWNQLKSRVEPLGGEFSFSKYVTASKLQSSALLDESKLMLDPPFDSRKVESQIMTDSPKALKNSIQKKIESSSILSKQKAAFELNADVPVHLPELKEKQSKLEELLQGTFKLISIKKNPNSQLYLLREHFKANPERALVASFLVPFKRRVKTSIRDACQLMVTDDSKAAESLRSLRFTSNYASEGLALGLLNYSFFFREVFLALVILTAKLSQKGSSAKLLLASLCESIQGLACCCRPIADKYRRRYSPVLLEINAVQREEEILRTLINQLFVKEEEDSAKDVLAKFRVPSNIQLTFVDHIPAELKKSELVSLELGQLSKALFAELHRCKLISEEMLHSLMEKGLAHDSSFSLNSSIISFNDDSAHSFFNDDDKEQTLDTQELCLDFGHDATLNIYSFEDQDVVDKQINWLIQTILQRCSTEVEPQEPLVKSTIACLNERPPSHQVILDKALLKACIKELGLKGSLDKPELAVKICMATLAGSYSELTDPQKAEIFQRLTTACQMSSYSLAQCFKDYIAAVESSALLQQAGLLSLMLSSCLQVELLRQQEAIVLFDALFLGSSGGLSAGNSDLLTKALSIASSLVLFLRLRSAGKGSAPTARLLAYLEDQMNIARSKPAIN